MSGWLILFVGAIYLYCAAEQASRRNYGLALAFFGYAVSNIGMYYTARTFGD